MDTAAKRRSAVQSSLVPIPMVFPVADSSIDADDRSSLAGVYGGNAFGDGEDAGGTRRIRRIAAFMKARARRA